MDLKIKDVADLLNVSETTIRRWLADGKIPAYKLNHQYRFSRDEIENWVLTHKVNNEKEGMVSLKGEKTKKILSNKMGSQAFSLYRAIYKGSVINDVPGSTKEEVIHNSVELMAENLDLDADVLLDLLLDREKLMPTALNHGIAVPHTRDFIIPSSYDIVSVVYPERPIEYGSLDGEKVHTLFFLFACSDKRHLHLLAKLAHFARGEENLFFLLERPGQKKLLDYIKSWESNIQIPVFV